jgi:hypothetical protein
MVADLYRWWYARRRIPANRLIVSSFVLMEPYWTIRTGSVPFWLKFNMEPSAEALEMYLSKADPYDDIYLMLFQHGVEAAGLPSGERWEALLGMARNGGHLLGLDLDEFPFDFAQYALYDDAIKEKIPARYPFAAPLTLDDLDRFLDARGDEYDVELT